MNDLLITEHPRCSGQVFEQMKALETKDLGVVNKFMGLHISLDKEVDTFWTKGCPWIYVFKVCPGDDK